MLPILELRGGIIAAYAMGMELLPAFIIAYIGNILPMPFLLLLIKRIFAWLKSTPLRGIVERLENRALNKKDTIEKYAYLGLFLFVAIPLPGTGGWTGSLIAALLDMDIKKSFLVIALGIFVAGVIVSALSFGLFDAIRSGM
ncbi:MAG: small multi-drug export protein [Firmicutes bacterium]|nr:small multi-drug export protein [Bacillota bacterium]